MIDFRYHLVSIVAVFLALAIGIVIGASALKPDVVKFFDNASTREQRTISTQQANIRNLENQLASNQAFAQAAAPRLLSGLLAGQQVALVTAPGADATTVNGVTAALKLAGAEITTQAALQPSFDFAVNEQCNEYSECGGYSAFTSKNKPVFNAEYASKYKNNTNGARDKLCAASKAANIRTLVLPLDLDGSFRYSCD